MDKLPNQAHTECNIMHISIFFQLITLINMICSSRLHTRDQIQQSGFGSLKGSRVLLFVLHMDCFMSSTLNWICFSCSVIQYHLTFHSTVTFQFYCSGSSFTLSEIPDPPSGLWYWLRVTDFIILLSLPLFPNSCISPEL